MKNIIVLVFVCLILLGCLIMVVYYLVGAIRLLFSTTKKAPYVPSFDRQLELMRQLKLKKGSTMVDLGCGDGKALRFFSKEHEIRLLDGFDINSYAIFKGKILNKYKKIMNVKLYKKDLFDVDLKKYDYIYVYLRASQLVTMEEWIRKEKKKDTVIISNTFQFKNHKPFKVYKNNKGIDTIFLYK